jgi:hypothetical protein
MKSTQGPAIPKERWPFLQCQKCGSHSIEVGTYPDRTRFEACCICDWQVELPPFAPEAEQ